MLNRGETLMLENLNSAFTNPKTISLAYYEASLLIEHIVDAYGDAGLRKLVRAYAQGVDTDAALKIALDTDLRRLNPFEKKPESESSKSDPAKAATKLEVSSGSKPQG